MQLSPRIRKLLLTIGKLLLTGAALWFVWDKIDGRSLLEELRTAHPLWLLLGALFFILSKLLSSFRLNGYFKSIGLVLSERINLKLYSLGMYYNLFLPGGIGGDGYKIYLLNKWYKVPGKKLFQAVLLDRISGLLAIVVLTLPLMIFIDLALWLKITALAGIPALYKVYNYLIKRFFPDFRRNLAGSNLYSVAVQLAQTCCVLLIMFALGIHDHYQAYLLIFFISSIVSVLPVTIGGIGVRELVFLFGARYFQLDEHSAVAISLLFFAITAVVSLAGVYFSFDSGKSALCLEEGTLKQ